MQILEQFFLQKKQDFKTSEVQANHDKAFVILQKTMLRNSCNKSLKHK